MERSAPDLFDQLYPDFMDRIRTYVADTGGAFLPPTLCHPPEAGYDSTGQLVKVQMAVRIRLGQHTVIQVACRARREGAMWRLRYRSFHFGPSVADMTLVYFRVDDSAAEPFHVHILGQGPKPEKGGHTAINRVEPPPGFPPLAHIDPSTFLDLVDLYRETRVLPLRVKTAP